jgi:hypothetical protein
VYSVTFRVVADRTMTVGARTVEPVNGDDCGSALEAMVGRSDAEHMKNAMIVKARTARTTRNACILSSRSIRTRLPDRTPVEDWTAGSKQQGIPQRTTGLDDDTPSAVYDPSSPNPVMVFVGGNNGHLVDKCWKGSKWVWEDQGKPPGDDSVLYGCGLSAVHDPTPSNPVAVFMADATTGDP